MKEDEAHAPALVISGEPSFSLFCEKFVLKPPCVPADTVVIYPTQSNLGSDKENTMTAAKSHVPSKILEKPLDKDDQVCASTFHP